MDKRLKFFLAIGLQVLIILMIIVFKYSIISGGVDVILRIQPIDPRDPLRGDYITFTYNISRLSNYLVKEKGLKAGDTVYVVLREGKTYWTPVRVSKVRPDFSESFFIKGKVSSVSNQNLRIVYGIEEYFIPEDKGRNFSFANKFVTAKVSLDKNGNPVLRQVYVDNKPWP